MSRKREGIQQDHQKDCRTGGCEVSRDFHWVTESGWLDIVKGSAPLKMKEEIAHIVRARDIGALAAVGSLAHPN